MNRNQFKTLSKSLQFTCVALCLVTFFPAWSSPGPHGREAGLAHIFVLMEEDELMEALISPSLPGHHLRLIYDEQLPGTVVAHASYFDVAVSISPSALKGSEICAIDETYFELDVTELTSELFKKHKARCLNKVSRNGLVDLNELEPTLFVIEQPPNQRLVDMVESIYVPEKSLSSFIEKMENHNVPLPPNRKAWSEVFKSTVRRSDCEDKLGIHPKDAS